MTAEYPVGPRPASLAVLAIMRDPYSAYCRYHKKFGDHWFVHAPNGRIHVGNTPEAAKEIFGADPDLYRPFGMEAAAPMIGDHSIFMLAGPRHRRERKLLMPAFHRERIAGYGERIQRIVREKLVELPEDGTVVAQEIGLTVTLDVILDIVFGATTAEERSKIGALLTETIHTLKPWMLFAPKLRALPVASGRWKSFLALREKADEMVRERIASARNEPEGTSVLHDMLAATDEDGVGMTDSEISDELVTLLFAGHETTGVAIAWTMYHLLRHPAELERLRAALAECDTTDPLSIYRCERLEAVCKEALRMTPILPDVLRTLTQPMTWQGLEIPEGHTVCVATVAIHHREDLYPEPNAFRPDRFLERRYRPWEYMPFGGGNRRCVGATLAEFELRLTVAELVMSCDARLPSDKPLRPVRRNITISPEGGTQMIVTRRAAAA